MSEQKEHEFWWNPHRMHDKKNLVTHFPLVNTQPLQEQIINIQNMIYTSTGSNSTDLGSLSADTYVLQAQIDQLSAYTIYIHNNIHQISSTTIYEQGEIDIISGITQNLIVQASNLYSTMSEIIFTGASLRQHLYMPNWTNGSPVYPPIIGGSYDSFFISAGANVIPTYSDDDTNLYNNTLNQLASYCFIKLRRIKNLLYIEGYIDPITTYYESVPNIATTSFLIIGLDSFLTGYILEHNQEMPYYLSDVYAGGMNYYLDTSVQYVAHTTNSTITDNGSPLCKRIIFDIGYDADNTFDGRFIRNRITFNSILKLISL